MSKNILFLILLIPILLNTLYVFRLVQTLYLKGYSKKFQMKIHPKIIHLNIGSKSSKTQNYVEKSL